LEKDEMRPWTYADAFPQDALEFDQYCVEGLVADGAITKDDLKDMRPELVPVAEQALAKKRGAPKGNQNARISRIGSVIIRLDATNANLLSDFFASEGNTDPTREDFQNAVYHAIRQIYGKKLEDDQTIII
jgi:hypothetical protein